jgi:AAA+ ATPase superfamily predicted ATPase
MLFDLHPKEKSASIYGRDEDLAKIDDHLSAGRWIMILGPRMVGKTSLVKAVGSNLEDKNITTLYLNLWGVNSMRSLLEGMVFALHNSSRLYSRLKRFLSNIQQLKVGPAGLSVKDYSRPMSLAWELFSVLGKNADEIVIIMDEVQELSDVSAHLSRLLAKIFNSYSKITFCFTGSQSGLVKSLHSPGPNSPMFGRSPEMLTIEPFDHQTATGFLSAGFKERKLSISASEKEDVFSRFGGIPGWLTLYGNKVVVSKMTHKKALDSTEKEAFITAQQALDHYLAGRNRSEHLVALKAIAIGAKWSHIRNVLEINVGKKINDGSLKNIIDALQASFLVKKRNSTYTLIDPVIQRLLQSGNIK